MAQKSFCDCCGQEIKSPELPAKFMIAKRVNFLMAGQTKEQQRNQLQTMDLCEDCGGKIEDSINNLKKKNKYYG